MQGILKRIEEVKSERSIYTEAMELLGKIILEREGYKKYLSLNPLDLEEKLIEVKLKEGFPLLDKKSFELKVEPIQEYFGRLLDLVKERNEKEVENIRNLFKKKGVSFEKLLEEWWKKRNLEKNLVKESKTAALLSFLLREALRPVLEFYRKKIKDKIEGQGWEKGYCPFCGEKPLIAELRGEEGKRFLFCSLCGQEWSYPRVKCPFCENEEQEKLSYFSIEGEEGYRVDLCKKCKGYIKTVDFRKFKRESFPEVENLATLHLDLLAQREGYKIPFSFLCL